MLLLNVPGAGEEAITSRTMFDGIQTKEASEVEEPMFHHGHHGSHAETRRCHS